MDYQTMAAMLLRNALVSAAGALVTHGVISAGQTETVVGAVMVLAGVAWSWWQKQGQANVVAELAKMSGRASKSATTADAAAVGTEAAKVSIAAKAATGAVLVAIALGGLLWGGQPAHAQQPAPESSILTRILADAQVALDDATAHDDKIAAPCYAAIIAVATARSAATTEKGGVLAMFQKVRDVMKINTSPMGTQLIMGCAPLVQDAKINMLDFFTKAGAVVLLKGILIP